MAGLATRSLARTPRGRALEKSIVKSEPVRRFSIIVAGLLIVTAAALAAWLWLPATVTIADAGIPIELTLRAPGAPKRVYALDVQGSGRIDGEAEVTLILNGQPYKVAHLSGVVHFEWGGDWYSPEAVVRYRPLSAKAGVIKLRYRFHSL